MWSNVSSGAPKTVTMEDYVIKVYDLIVLTNQRLRSRDS